MKSFTIMTSDSNVSEDTIYCKKPINPVTNILFSNTDVILGLSPGSSDKNSLPSPPSVSEINSKSIDNWSTVQIPSNSEKKIILQLKIQ